MNVQNRMRKNILVTGGCGFIGSNFIRFLFDQADFSGIIVNVDLLTYAGNKDNLADIEHDLSGKRYFFEHANICDHAKMTDIFSRYEIDTVVHFAAESHVDRSIYGPKDFIETNIVGTFTLLEAARNAWEKRSDVLFHHVSTDEVFGSLGGNGYFTETTPYDPRSPYSASKASSDHLVRAMHHTYGLPVTISNCSNNYGPYQFPEKLIPVIILNMFEEKPLPVYGDGGNVRDWLHVADHASAVWQIIKSGVTGDTYNIGGENEWQNLRLVELICEKGAAIAGKPGDYYKKLITFVKDRPGHDRRYAIDCSKIKSGLGWKNGTDFISGITETIVWYRTHMGWVERIRRGEYRKWMEINYDKR